MRTLLFLLVAATVAGYQGKKAPPLKPASLEVSGTTAHRDQGLLLIDSRMKNVGERAAEDLVVIVDVLDSDKRAITTQKGSSEPESLGAGEEAEFHAQMRLPPRAVYIRLSFEDGEGRDIKASNTGPFPID